MVKRCTKCGILKPLSEFYKSKRYSDGHYCACKSCYDADAKRRRVLLPKRHWAIHTLNHHRRKYNVTITTDELVEFVSDKEHCEICGKKITWYSGVKHLISSSPTLDRLNNESDIHINNIQLLCNECNRTKGTKTMKEFVNYCKIVSSKYEDLCESE